MKMGAKKKNLFLKSFNRFLNSPKRQLRKSLAKFHMNAYVKIISLKVLNVLLDSNDGRITSMFKTWKGIPPAYTP